MIGGLCNQCGACCWVGAYKCTNLITAKDGRAACAVYGDREPGMDIVLTRASDNAWMRGTCNHKTPEEQGLLRQLIEQGICSLEVTGNG